MYIMYGQSVPCPKPYSDHVLVLELELATLHGTVIQEFKIHVLRQHILRQVPVASIKQR